MSKEIIATQNRAEELLLELVYDRLLNSRSKPPTDDENAAEDERMTELFFPPDAEELARRKGYHDGWWEAVESLREIISAHDEGNDYRLEKWSR